MPTSHPSYRPATIAALLALLMSSGAGQAQTLAVKPGLWEITLDGAPSPSPVCYTVEALKAGLSQVSVPPGLSCRNEIKMAGAKSMLTRTVCAGNVSLEGETRIDILSPESMNMVSGSMLIVDGRKQSRQSTGTYRWLRADCGKVKPQDPALPLQPMR